MIGPYVLACLDMAGTTVRDDGAVEAAFDDALAAVGVARGTLRHDEAHRFVHETMGWSKADVFAELLDTEDTRRATARFASAYEAIVAAGTVEAIDGASDVLRELRARGVRTCLTTGFAPSTRDALLDALGWRADIDLALSPATAHVRRRPTSSWGRWPGSGSRILERSSRSGIPSATSRPARPPACAPWSGC